jgi:hypothetical protein
MWLFHNLVLEVQLKFTLKILLQYNFSKILIYCWHGKFQTNYACWSSSLNPFFLLNSLPCVNILCIISISSKEIQIQKSISSFFPRQTFLLACITHMGEGRGRIHGHISVYKCDVTWLGCSHSLFSLYPFPLLKRISTGRIVLFHLSI